MDRVTALVAIAHLKLRLQLIERSPQLVEGSPMPIDLKRPMELAGMKSRLIRATKLEESIAVTGRRYDQVLDAIDEHHAAFRGHVGSLENEKAQLDQVISRMVAGSNGGPNEDGEKSLDGSGAEPGQVIISSTDDGNGQVATKTEGQE